MSALGSLFTEDYTSLLCIDLYETDGLLLFRPKSIIRKTIDLERVIENAENIYYFYLDSNWEFRFIEYKYRRISDSFGQVMRFSGIRKTYLRHKKNDMLNNYIHSVILKSLI